MNTTKPILVTGGAGFIGSHLCKSLVTKGQDVLCLDNFYTGSVENVAELQGHDNFRLVEHDVTKTFETSVGAIYNLACPASPIHYQRDPVQTVRTSVLGAINMLDLALQMGCRIFQASTSEVYGSPEVHPQTESYNGNVNPIGPRACYDEGKRCAETLFFDYARQFELSVRVARIFNTYGPRMQPNDGRVVSNFVMQALQGAPITIYGKGMQTRSFCYVDDMVAGLEAIMNLADPVTGPINLGNPHEITMLELAETVFRLTGTKENITYLPLPPDDPPQRQPDISLAKKCLNWEPTISLEDGLTETIAYFRQLLA
ncbi:MAG: SDR family oxidoreductase [Alphaproteobacteria bacterium]